MKKAVFVVLQTLFLLAAYACGVVLQFLSKIPTWSSVTGGGKSVFFWDGLVFLGIGVVLIYIEQAIRKVLRHNWGIPLMALVLSLLLLAGTQFPMSSMTPSGV